MSIENIQFILKKLDEEHTHHLQKKAELSQEVKELTQKELKLRKTLTELQTAVSSMTKLPTVSTDTDNISQLVIAANDLENEVVLNRQHSIAVETELTHERVQLEMIKNKIDVLNSEKEDLEAINRQKKQEQLVHKSESRKLQSKRERLEKLRKQIEKQELFKENLSNLIYISTIIEQVIQNDSTINQEEKREIKEVSPEITEVIVGAKAAFQDAQTKFSANDLTPFLQDADQAYQMGVKSWILLSKEIIDDLTEQPFSDQVFAIVNEGLTLNTRQISAVESMLQKIQKGVEIAPLASFANEIREYFIENLSLLRINLPSDE
jgi:chromosome segregation ATPase